MNCLNKLLLGVRAKAQARPGIKSVNVGASKVGMAPGLADRRAGVLKSTSEELELIKQVDLLDSSLARFQVMV